MIDVDFDRIADRSDELIEYDGFLPLLIRALIIDKWSDYLLSVGKYDEVMDECSRNKPHTLNEAVKELVAWVKDNKDYKDLIK